MDEELIKALVLPKINNAQQCEYKSLRKEEKEEKNKRNCTCKELTKMKGKKKKTLKQTATKFFQVSQAKA